MQRNAGLLDCVASLQSFMWRIRGRCGERARRKQQRANTSLSINIIGRGYVAHATTSQEHRCHLPSLWSTWDTFGWSTHALCSLLMPGVNGLLHLFSGMKRVGTAKGCLLGWLAHLLVIANGNTVQSECLWGAHSRCLACSSKNCFVPSSSPSSLSQLYSDLVVCWSSL